jgi:hypothetical protein
MLFDETFNDSNTSFLLSSANHLSTSSLPLLSPPSLSKKNAGVRFDEDKNTFHSPNFALEDLKSRREALWYSPDECKHFQETARFLGEHYARSNSAYGAILQRIYSRACSSSGNGNDDTVYGGDVDMEQQHLQHQQDHMLLTNIIKESVEKLGLERRIAFGLLHHVTAQKIVMNSVAIRGKGVVDDDDNAEHIRVVCEGMSRSSRLFAMYLAKAVASSIVEEEKEEEEEENQHGFF